MVGNTLIKIADYCPVNKRIFEVDETAYLSFDADCVPRHKFETTGRQR